MNKLHQYKRGFFLIFVLCCSFSYSQSNQVESQYYNWFDQIVGIANTALYNGVEYIETHRTTRENHKFLGSVEFVEGTVDYDGQRYYSVPMKYNVFDDELLVKLSNRKGESIIQLIKSNTYGFSIADKFFLNINTPEARMNGVMGFYELLLTTESFTLYKKNRKNRLKIIRNNSVVYDFSESKGQFLLFRDGHYIPISARRDIADIFPQFKKELKKYYLDNPTFRNLDKETLFKTLLKQVVVLLNEQS